MRIAFFGGHWPLSRHCFETLLDAGHELALVTMPVPVAARLKRKLRFLGHPQIERMAQEAAAPIMRFRPRDIERDLSRFGPDLICIATFPERIPDEVARIAALGAINVHPSLLPRHRGTNPLFWLYHAGDVSTGVTVHRVVHRFDAGPVIAQRSIDVPRGYPVEKLARGLIDLAPETLMSALSAIADGAPADPQREELATFAPAVDLRRFTIPFDAWNVERVWHFLAGFRERYSAPLTDQNGVLVTYEKVPAFSRNIEMPPGTVVWRDGGWSLGCRDGTVFLER